MPPQFVFWRPKYFDAQTSKIRQENKLDKNNKLKGFLEQVIVDIKNVNGNLSNNINFIEKYGCSHGKLVQKLYNKPLFTHVFTFYLKFNFGFKIFKSLQYFDNKL
jgi:hypothetical protein